jgi:hypothetical protein
VSVSNLMAECAAEDVWGYGAQSPRMLNVIVQEESKRTGHIRKEATDLLDRFKFTCSEVMEEQAREPVSRLVLLYLARGAVSCTQCVVRRRLGNG